MWGSVSTANSLIMLVRCSPISEVHGRIEISPCRSNIQSRPKGNKGLAVLVGFAHASRAEPSHRRSDVILLRSSMGQDGSPEYSLRDATTHVLYDRIMFFFWCVFFLLADYFYCFYLYHFYGYQYYEKSLLSLLLFLLQPESWLRIRKLEAQGPSNFYFLMQANLHHNRPRVPQTPWTILSSALHASAQFGASLNEVTRWGWQI
jgi:hypothetical protein